MAKLTTIEDPILGSLKPNEKLKSYEGETQWNGETVKISLVDVSKPERLQTALTAAHNLWQEQYKWQGRIMDFAVAKLLPLKNDSWLEEDEKELSSAQFRHAMRLESIDLDFQGNFTFWFNDGELFWGHLIQVCGDLENGPTDADILG